MKHTIKLLVLLAAVLAVTACNRDETAGFEQHSVLYVVSRHDIPTTTTTVYISKKEELDALFDLFCDYTKQGKFVTFRGNKKGSSMAKDANTFSTTNREEMRRWMARMEDLGMTVTVTYNPATGTWTGMAYVNPPRTEDAESGRLERVTMDCSYPGGREVHAVYTFFWDGNKLVNVDMVNEDFQHYLLNMQPYDTIFYSHHTAHITYNDSLRSSMYIYDADGEVVEYYLYSYADGRLVREEQSYNTYTFNYNSDGLIESWIITPGWNTALPNGVHCVWANGDVVQLNNQNGQLYMSFEYDTMPCPYGITSGTKVLLPGMSDAIPYWSRHNVTYMLVPDKKSTGFEMQLNYTYGNGYPVIIESDNTIWTLEYIE